MSISHVLLGLLSHGEKHGYDLKREYDARFPQTRPLAFGQVYATLDRLLRDGLIVTTGTERTSGPERTAYALTDTGREALSQWLSTVEPPAPYVVNPLFAKVAIALLHGDGGSTATQYLRAQRAAHLERMRSYTAIKLDSASAIGEVLAADHALAHLDADLRWIDTALARMTALSQEVAP
ncbi:MAG: helix-turn-helix transcriptional regulator [Mycobacteriales bacterium]